MLRSTLSRIADVIRTDGWWLGPQAVVVVVLSLTVGIWGLWVTYAAFNSALVMLFANERGPRKRRRLQTALKVLAIPLLPFGLISALKPYPWAPHVGSGRANS